MAEELEIGRVGDYFARIGVAGVELTGELRVGDAIHIKGATTDLTAVVQSLEIDRVSVEAAGAGDSIGVLVSERCRVGDHVFKVAG